MENRNRGCTDRLDAVAGTCNLQSFDFEGDAREYVRSLSHFFGDNGGGSCGYYLANCRFLQEGKSWAPSPQSSPRKRGEADHTADLKTMNDWNTDDLAADRLCSIFGVVHMLTDFAKNVTMSNFASPFLKGRGLR